MKFCVGLVVLLMTVGVSMGVILGYGRPGCKTDKELTVKQYRHLFDPTMYWLCSEKGVPAASFRCPDMTAWDDTKKQCVDWDSWSWEDPVDPPSNP